jgi:general secretion pathway protein A
MVLDYYGLREQPFGTTPDSRYLFESETHREALASILFGIEAGRGFIALIAKPGMGKTTLLFRGLSELRQKGRTVFLFQTISTPLDFLRTLLADLGVQELQGGVFELQAKLNEILMEQSRRGERLVVVIDETQNLDESVLELVRMLSNFETPTEKLMQIVMSGQPQLARKLASPGLVQLRQRISIIAHLRPFSTDETMQYINHRLASAGYRSDSPLFTPAALGLIAEHSEGIPRNVNNLCFNALSLGCAMKRKSIDVDIIREVIADLDLDSLSENAEVSVGSTSSPVAIAVPTAKPTSHMWLPKAAFASVALFAISGATIQRGSNATVLAKAIPTIGVKAAPSTSLAEVPPAPSATPSASAPSSPAPKKQSDSHATILAPPGMTLDQSSDVKAEPPDQESRILVPHGITLYRICTETLGTCHSRELDEFHRLNPWLTNPDHLESGRELRLPPPKGLSTIAQSPGGAPVNRSLEVSSQ